nr:hypothetical protein [Deltaproteobacteria bacterium]
MNPTSRKVISVCMCFLLVAAWTGCETMDETYQEHKGATVGAGAGAVVGAIAGSAMGDGADAAILGGLLGALAGAAIGHYAYDKQKERDETVREYENYDPSQGTVVDVKNVTTNPQTISPGETVNLNATYAVLTPAEGTAVSVKETRKIYFNGALVGNPEVTVQRTGGTYTSSIPLQLPATAQKGLYTVEATIQSGASTETGNTSFTVS